MVNRLNIFKLPKFDDPERERVSGLLSYVLWGFQLIFTIVLVIAIIFLSENINRWITILLLLNIFITLIHFLNHKGYYNIASYSFIGFNLLLLTTIAWSANGLLSPVSIGMPIIVLLASFLQGKKASFFTALIAVIIELFLLLAASFDILPPSTVHHTQFSMAISAIAWVFAVVMLQSIYWDSLSNALNRAISDNLIRKKVEVELVKSESFRRKIFELSNLTTLLIDGDTHLIIDCNKAALEAFKFNNRSELIGISFLQISADIQYDGTPSSVKLYNYIEDAKLNDSYRFEWRNRYENGIFWDSDAHLTSFVDEQKSILQLVLIDVTEKKQINRAFYKLSNEFAAFSGNEFFEEVSKYASIEFGLDYVYVGELSKDNLSISTLGGYALGEVMNDFTYALQYTPCSNVMDSQACIYPKEVQQLFPRDFLLKDMKISAYLGLPIYGDDLKPVGIFVALSLKPIENGEKVFNFLNLFTERITSELKRLKSYNLLLEEIDHRQMLEKELRENKTRLESISDNFKEGIIYQVAILPNGERNFTFLSQSFLDIFGISPEEGLKNSNLIYGRVYEDDFAGFANAENDALQNFKSFTHEARFYNLNRELVWLSLVSTPKLLENGVVSWDGIGQVITQRKVAEEQNEIMAAQLKANLDNSPNVAIQWYNELGEVTYWNKASESIYGFNPEEIIGKTTEDYILDNNGFKEFLDILQTIKRTGEAYGPYECKVFNKNGEERWVLATTFAFPVGRNSVGYSCMDVDITAQKRAELSLYESQQRFKNLIKLSPFPMSLTTLDGEFMIVNDEFVKVVNIPEKEIIGKTTAMLGYTINQEATDAIAKLRLTGENIDNLEITLHKNRELSFIYLLSSRVIRWDESDYILNSLVNITDKKMLERELADYRSNLELIVEQRTLELEKSNLSLQNTNSLLSNEREELSQVLSKLKNTQEKLIQAEKFASLGILASGIAHEINNPLNFIYGGVLGIEMVIEENNIAQRDEMKPFIDAINLGVDRAAKIVKSLNHYSQKDDDSMANCDLNSIIENCISMIKGQLRSGVDLIVNLSDKPCIVNGNEGKLHKALLVVLSNAEQAILESGNILIETQTSDEYVSVVIKDSGVGISEENLKRLYDPFFTTKSPGEGTGLGLSIALKIIQDHCGTIEHQSLVGYGTSVSIKLPITRDLLPVN